MLWVLVSRTLNEPDGLSNSTSAVDWHVDLCTCAWYFTRCFVKFESTVVTFEAGVVGLKINVWYCFWKFEKLVFVPLLKFSATSQTLSLRHPTHAATSDPLVTQRLWNQFPHRIYAGGNLLFTRCVSLTLTGLVSAWRRGEAPWEILAKPLSDCVTVLCLR